MGGNSLADYREKHYERNHEDDERKEDSLQGSDGDGHVVPPVKVSLLLLVFVLGQRLEGALLLQ